MNYIPLNIKTNYSLLKSLIDINKLIEFAKENNIKKLGICDDNLFGVMDFYTLCKKNDIKPFIGLEITLNENKNILLYAKSYKGYQSLCKITSNEKTYEFIEKNSEDLLCIIPYESIDVFDKYKNIFKDIFISYKSKEERNNIKGKPCLFLNEIRCLTKEEVKYIKYAYMIKDGKKMFINGEYDFKNNYFDYKDEINKTDFLSYEIVDKLCNVTIKKQHSLLPKYSNDPDFDEKEFLKKLCEKGLLKRLNNKLHKKYVDRLYYELDIINKMNFSNYFLVVWDFIKYSKNNNILVGPGRGSAPGSLVSYSLGITNVDPIKYNLVFERFLNPERVTMPDIDIDFDSTKRDNVINYVKRKYGTERVANIITFGTLKSKQVLRDVSRLFDYDIDYFIKLFDSNLSLNQNRTNSDEIKSYLRKDTLLNRIYDISTHLEGLKRHSSINAAGIVISSENLSNYIPVYKQNETLVTGFTIDYLEKLGFLKMDFLSIDNLDLLSKLKEETKIDLNSIPLDDKKTLEIFNNANTDGIFQFESSGIRNILKKYKIEKFDDLIALLALYRPGPMDNIDSYIRRKEGKEKIIYIHEDLKEILKETYGIIVYQEQIMQIARSFAGFSLGEADVLRRAMSKKKKEELENLKNKFIYGSISNGYSEKIALEIYNLIYKFSNYGFNKSHSVCYALISYELAYLKANYMPYFMCHLLTMVGGNINKINDYILECKNNKINILKPDINKSFDYFNIENNSIRYSLSSIKNIGTIISKKILDERTKKEFSDFFDFILRTHSFVNKKILFSLINSGCFDTFKFNQKTLINSIDIIFNYVELIKDLDSSFVEKPEIKVFEEYSKNELIEKEFEVFGFYLSNHPVQFKRKNKITTKDIKSNFDKIISIYLLVDKKREIITKKGDKMAFFEAEDEYDKVTFIVFSKLYERCYKIKKGDIVFITGRVERRNDEYQIIVNRLEKL